MDSLDIRTITAAFLGAVIIIGIMGGIIYSLIKPDLENLRNIPDKVWFDKVGAALEKINILDTNSGSYSKRLDKLEDRVLDLEKKSP